MDLLRGAVAGAAGTPYHDQLFFFDIQLPPEYPNVPPLVQYHSWGMRANPNLVRCVRYSAHIWLTAACGSDAAKHLRS